MATPGGPLLTVADMLRDLSENSPSEDTDSRSASLSSASSFARSSANQKAAPVLEARGLPGVFEDTYKQLDKALKQPGHDWTGLTQELCAMLTTADKLVASAHSSLGQLSTDVKRLEDIVERGQKSFVKLQDNISK